MQVQDKLVTRFENDFQKLCFQNDIQNETGSKNNKFDEVIDNIAAKEGYIKYTAKQQKIEANGGNYLGELYVIDIKGITPEGNKETNIFVKQSLSDCKLTIVNIEDVFSNEIFVYDELTNIFNQLQDNANIPQDDRFTMVKCYHTVNRQTVFLENMSKKDFTVPDRMETISLQYAESCIATLAKFHALSFALQKKNPDYFENKIKPIDYPMTKSEEWIKFVVDSFKHAVSTLKTVEDQNRLETLLPRVKNNFIDYFKDDARVLVHGDYRSNNILQKKTITGEIITIPIDYQCIYYGNPMNDFMYFILGATDKNFRDNHLPHLKELYYNTMSNFLKYFSLKIEDIYPKEEFNADYESRLEYGLIIATMLLPFILAPEDDFPDFSDQDLTDVEFVLTDQYKERMKGIFDNYVEWRLI